MKVYIAVYDDGTDYGDHIIEMFATRELANKFIENRVKNDWSSDKWCYSVDEWTVKTTV